MWDMATPGVPATNTLDQTTMIPITDYFDERLPW